MQMIKWYARGSYDSVSENLEEVNRVTEDLSEKAKKILAEQLRDKFYEVEFDVEVDEKTGKILKVTAVNV
jgi:hypothetical protein